MTLSTPKFTISRNFRQVAFDLEDFRRKHPRWLEPFEEAGPVYRLPRTAIQSLQKSLAGKQPLLTDSEAETELAFLDLCDNMQVLGFWQKMPVRANYLQRMEFPADSELANLKLGWPRQSAGIARQLVAKSDSTYTRLKGYVGWLITEPDFLRARDELASRWQTLPEGQRPYPIGRSLRGPVPPSSAVPVEDIVAIFQHDLNAFLDRWGLTGMLTWDLPEPQGPLLPAQLPLDSPAMPRHGLHLVLPIHYPLTGNDDLLRQIREQQVALAKSLQIDTSIAGLPHFEAYGQILEVSFLELIIRSRCSRPGRCRGLITSMESVIGETIHRSRNQVQKLRKAISACRAGKRSKVGWLKARD